MRTPNANLFRCRPHLLALALVLSASAARPEVAAYEKGQMVTVTGTVTDQAGQPLAGVEVTLEASVKGPTLAPPRFSRTAIKRASTETDDAGRYRLEWRWDPKFKTYQLAAAVRWRHAGNDRLEVLALADVSRRILQGSPAVVGLTAADSSFFYRWRQLERTLDSDDEKRVYREVGLPDQIDERASGQEAVADWWYFDLGRVYHFRDGVFRRVDEFDPIPGFGS